MNSWTLCLLIGSFVPLPHFSAITSVTCECRKTEVNCARILGQKDRKSGSDFFPARVMARLKEAEAREAEPFYQQHIRQAWIILSLLQKGVANPFVRSSYAIYGVHPDFVWQNIVADRKARLCDEYFTWYTSDDVLRPDVPKIPHNTADADTHAANEASHDDWDIAGLVPQERKLV